MPNIIQGCDTVTVMLRCPLEDIYFMWTFYFYFSPRWECFHRGENILTAVETFPPRWEVFPPRWEHSHHGENVSQITWLPTAVETFPPRWECITYHVTSHRGGNTSHRGENVFPPRWEHSHRGENIPTAVRTFPPRWEVFPRDLSRDLWRYLRAPPSRAATCDTIHPIIETEWNTVKYTRLEYGSLPSSTIKYGSLQPSTIAYGPHHQVH